MKLFKIALMSVRLAFVLTLAFVGAAQFGATTFPFHMLTGLLLILGTIAVAFLSSAARGLLWASPITALLGVTIALKGAPYLGLSTGWVHLLSMVAAVGLAEAGAARHRRMVQKQA